MPKYYGPLEVISEAVDADGNVTISFAQQEGQINKNPVVLPKVAYDTAITDVPSDWNSLRDRRLRPVVKEFLETLLKYNILIEEIDFALSQLTVSINSSVAAGNDFLWGQREGERSMLHLHGILKRLPPEEPKQPASTDGTPTENTPTPSGQ